MAGCERLLECQIVNNPNEEVVSVETLKEKYCNTNYSACARYKVLKSVGGDFVPNDLLPDEVERAKQIIEEALEWM
jgi:hypothetical protein